MGTLFGWLLGLTKIGKMFESIRQFLDGKKQAIASLAAAIPAIFLIIKNFTDQGNTYLITIAHTPEFLAASAGLIGFFNALKGEKIRNEIAAVSQPPIVVSPPVKVETVSVTTTTPTTPV